MKGGRRKGLWRDSGSELMEDLPSFLIVLVALGVFMASILYSTTRYLKAQDGMDKYGDCRSLLERVRGYGGLTVNGTFTAQPVPGVFSLEKLNGMNASMMKGELSSRREFAVEIVDLEDENGRWMFGEPPSDRADRTTLQSGIIIRTQGEEYHVARLSVTIW